MLLLSYFLISIERYLKVDHEAEMKELEGRVADIMDGLSGARGLTVERYMPPIANHVPHVRLSWSEGAFKFDAGDVVHQMMEGDPPIAVSRRGDRLVQVSVWMMRPGEHKIVAKRLQEVFARA